MPADLPTPRERPGTLTAREGPDTAPEVPSSRGVGQVVRGGGSGPPPTAETTGRRRHSAPQAVPPQNRPLDGRGSWTGGPPDRATGPVQESTAMAPQQLRSSLLRGGPAHRDQENRPTGQEEGGGTARHRQTAPNGCDHLVRRFSKSRHPQRRSGRAHPAPQPLQRNGGSRPRRRRMQQSEGRTSGHTGCPLGGRWPRRRGTPTVAPYTPPHRLQIWTPTPQAGPIATDVNPRHGHLAPHTGTGRQRPHTHLPVGPGPRGCGRQRGSGPAGGGGRDRGTGSGTCRPGQRPWSHQASRHGNGAHQGPGGPPVPDCDSGARGTDALGGGDSLPAAHRLLAADPGYPPATAAGRGRPLSCLRWAGQR